MAKHIVNIDYINYQLISISIDLVYKVLALNDYLSDELKNNPHMEKAHKIAQKWNSVFLDGYVLSKEGK